MLNLVGLKTGKLSVLAFSHIQNRHSKWLCRCDCGNEKIIFGSHLKNGTTKSCGCLIIKKLIERNTKHNQRPRGTKSPEYISWIAMKQRCYNPKHIYFHRYGGRGIAVCDQWRNSFSTFLSDLGTRSAGYTLGRIDNKQGYKKDNCKWMSQNEQNTNKNNSHLITIDNTTKTISEWCRCNNMKLGTAIARLKRGWSPKKAISIPVRKQKMSTKQSQIGKSNVRRAKTHERRVAKLLSEWSGVEFRRRRVEGRDRSTVARESTSDVIAVDRIFKFSVEAKCGKGFSIDALLASPDTAIFTSWWFQTSYDAELLSNFLKQPIAPMLFFKPEPNFDWIAIPISSLKSFGISYAAIESESKCLRCILYHYNTTVNHDISHSKNKHIIQRQLESVAICRWKNFAACVDPAACFYSNDYICH